MRKQLSEVFGELYHEVMMSGIFSDSKSFSDAHYKVPVEQILIAYKDEKPTCKEELQEFINTYFDLPLSPTNDFKTNPDHSLDQHIQSLWDVLTRSADEEEASSRIPLPYPYIVPGGRFAEIYYWDSYFTMLGLKIHNRWDLIESMLKNFKHLIETFGFIPNGTRSYFLGRSQPPFFSHMVELLAEKKGDQVWIDYLSTLIKEYSFWMKPPRIIELPDGQVLNRYNDNIHEARPESYREDIVLVEAKDNPKKCFENLRAACESGWDFSSRWMKDANDLSSIECAAIIPVDLNALLVHLEKSIAKAYQLLDKNNPANKEIAQKFLTQAKDRITLINKYCWNEELNCYCDYNHETIRQTNKVTAAMVVPLFCKIADADQAQKTALSLEQNLVSTGGVLTTVVNSGQQWDAPNGWAPLQWMAVKGLDNYNLTSYSKEIAQKFVSIVERVFESTGKLLEKYNVENDSLLAGGGEYPVQDGFGWTNGVYLALKNYLTAHS